MIKIQYSELKQKSKDELLKMKKRFEYSNIENRYSTQPKKKGYNHLEVRKNIARINQILSAKKEH